MTGTRGRATVVALAVTLGLAGCGDGGETEVLSGGGERVDVELSEWDVVADPEQVGAGEISFAVDNAGQAPHELVVIRTSTAADALPVGDGGTIDDSGDDVEVVDEVEDVAAGSTAELTVDLEAGHYALVCDLPGHYQQGMHADLDVE